MAAVHAYPSTPQRGELHGETEVVGEIPAGDSPVLAMQASIAEAFHTAGSNRLDRDVKFIDPRRLAVIGALALAGGVPIVAVAAWLA